MRSSRRGAERADTDGSFWEKGSPTRDWALLPFILFLHASTPRHVLVGPSVHRMRHATCWDRQIEKPWTVQAGINHHSSGERLRVLHLLSWFCIGCLVPWTGNYAGRKHYGERITRKITPAMSVQVPSPSNTGPQSPFERVWGLFSA